MPPTAEYPDSGLHFLYSAPLLMHLTPFLSRKSLLSLSATSKPLRTLLLPYFFPPVSLSSFCDHVPLISMNCILIDKAHTWRVASYIRSLSVSCYSSRDQDRTEERKIIWGSDALNSVNALELTEGQLTVGEVLAARNLFWKKQLVFFRVGTEEAVWPDSLAGWLQALRVLELPLGTWESVGSQDEGYLLESLANKSPPAIKTWLDALPMHACVLEEITLNGIVRSWERMLKGYTFRAFLDLVGDGERVPMLRTVRIPLTVQRKGNGFKETARIKCLLLLWHARVRYGTTHASKGGWRLGSSSKPCVGWDWFDQYGLENKNQRCICEWRSGSRSSVVLSIEDIEALTTAQPKKTTSTDPTIDDYHATKLAHFFEEGIHLTIPKHEHSGGNEVLIFRSELLGRNEIVHLDVSKRQHCSWADKAFKHIKCLSLVLYGLDYSVIANPDMEEWQKFWGQVLSVGAASLVIQCWPTADSGPFYSTHFTPYMGFKVLNIQTTTAGLDVLEILTIDLNMVPGVCAPSCFCGGKEHKLAWLSSCRTLQKLRLENWRCCLRCWKTGENLRALVLKLPKSMLTLEPCGTFVADQDDYPAERVGFTHRVNLKNDIKEIGLQYNIHINMDEIL